MNLKNLKNVKASSFSYKDMPEKTKIEAQIAFTIGILTGAIASCVLILFFTPWEWYFKLFSLIGSLGIIGTLIMSLMASIKMRKDYVETQEEMKKILENTNTAEIPEKLKGGVKC